MKRLRMPLVICLLLALPLVGLAAVMPIAQCPMQTQADGGPSAPAAPCCDDMVNASCKPSEPCRHCDGFQPLNDQTLTVVPEAFVPPLLATPDGFFIAHDPGGLWRPPRTL